MILTNSSAGKARKKEELLALPDIIRLDGSRCPYPPPASVLTAVQDCATAALREAENGKELEGALAELFGVLPDNLCLCCCPAAAYACEGVHLRDRSHLLREEKPALSENAVFVYDLGRCCGLLGVNAWALVAQKSTAVMLRAVCRRLKVPPPDRAATAAILAALKDPESIEKWRSMVENTLLRTLLWLNGNGFSATKGEGPYLDVKIPAPSRAAFELLQCGIAVETGQDGIRIWSGTEEEMERLFYCLLKMKEKLFR